MQALKSKQEYYAIIFLKKGFLPGNIDRISAGFSGPDADAIFARIYFFRDGIKQLFILLCPFFYEQVIQSYIQRIIFRIQANIYCGGIRHCEKILNHFPRVLSYHTFIIAVCRFE
jgi:hypothetical protein